MENDDVPHSRPKLAGSNIEHAGLHNQRVVLHAIRVAGAATRAEIARETGLTPATVSNITNRLLDTGLLQPAGQRRGERGQPATRLQVSPDSAFSIGINIDRDHLTMVAVDFSGAVRARINHETAFPMPKDVATFYRENVRDLLRDADITPKLVSGIGVALPDDLGAVDLPGRPVNYNIWSTIDIAGLFEQPFDLPVIIDNDAAAAAIGEMQFGMGQQYSSFFYLLVTFGLGGGVVVNSLYDHGANGRSGEIGFLAVDDGQGRKTQLQNIVSLAGLARAFADAGLSETSVRQADMRDPAIAAVAHAWVERAAGALVEPLIAVSCLLDPAVILIGGRLPIALVGQLADRANALLKQYGAHAPALAPIQAAALAEDSPAVGAALLPFRHLMLPANVGGIRRERTPSHSSPVAMR